MTSTGSATTGRVTARRMDPEEIAVARKRAKRKHLVSANLRIQQLSKTGTSLELEIFQLGRKIGTLTVGRGSLFWRGGKRQKEKHIRWGRFAAMMDDLAYG